MKNFDTSLATSTLTIEKPIKADSKAIIVAPTPTATSMSEGADM